MRYKIFNNLRNFTDNLILELLLLILQRTTINIKSGSHSLELLIKCLNEKVQLE